MESFYAIPKSHSMSMKKIQLFSPQRNKKAAIQPPEDHQPEVKPLDPQGAPIQPDVVDTETAAARPAEIRFDHRQLNFYQPVITRSGRRVIRPDYLAGHNT